jgi:hypothetical protein
MIERPADACLETCSTCRFWRPERTVGDGYRRTVPPMVMHVRLGRVAPAGDAVVDAPSSSAAKTPVEPPT